MRPSVRNAFASFTATFEGRISWMYLDVKGLVTTGLGCLIDPESRAQLLPFKRSNGEAATVNEIASEWRKVKMTTSLAKQGARAAERITTLRLSETAINAVATSTLDTFEKYLKITFPNWETWPADAQLAVFSMAWAMGPGFTYVFKKLRASALAEDWVACAAECAMRTEGNPGLIPRNHANIALFLAASTSTTPEVLTGWSKC